MRAKPTSGPMEIEPTEQLDREIFTAGGVLVATFYNQDAFGIGPDEAEANARAWVDGIAAIEKLERIEHTIRNADLDNNEVVAEVRLILRAKP